MRLFWAKGAMFVKDMIQLYDDPKPHINTVSTQVRILDKDGFLGHKQYGGSFQYFPLMTEGQYRKNSLSGVIDKWFGNSYLSAVSTLLKDEKISIEDLKGLIAEVEGKETENNEKKG